MSKVRVTSLNYYFLLYIFLRFLNFFIFNCFNFIFIANFFSLFSIATTLKREPFIYSNTILRRRGSLTATNLRVMSAITYTPAYNHIGVSISKDTNYALSFLEAKPFFNNFFDFFNLNNYFYNYTYLRSLIKRRAVLYNTIADLNSFNLDNFFYRINSLNIKPFFCLNNFFKKKVVNSLLKYRFASIAGFSFLLTIPILEKIYSSKVVLNINNSYINNFLFFKLKPQLLLYKLNFLDLFLKNSLLHSLLNLLYLKDSALFLRWLRLSFLTIDFRKHRRLLSHVFFILDRVFSIAYIFGVMGWRLILSGKIGSVGNLRKKRFICYNGRSSLSDYSLHHDEFRLQISLYSGAIGMRFFLSYT